MGEDYLNKLRRLGVTKGARDLKPAQPKTADDVRRPYSESASGNLSDTEDDRPELGLLLPGGQVVQNEMGGCFVLDHVYPASFRHGSHELGDLVGLSAESIAGSNQDIKLLDLQIEDFLFLDTETTGLTGAGTLAFLVGVGFFEKDSTGNKVYVVRQYFLRDHGDEAAMLHLLAQLLATKAGLVTFNGRSFDVPLLDTRYLMNRLDDIVGDLMSIPHIDLLQPARRLWRRRLRSCSLDSLEKKLLGVNRGQEDVPGWVIPGLYMDYLRSGDAREMVRVFYHNKLDMLSMVTLATKIARLIGQPDHAEHPLDLFSLARWQISQGRTTDAERNLQLVAGQDLPLEIFHLTLYELSMLLKRNERRSEAVDLWQQIAVTSFSDISAHVELAKHYEWHHPDLEKAQQWTQSAINLANRWQSTEAEMILSELQHRLARLERKLGQQ